MSAGVGGQFDHVGQIEADLMTYFGLQSGMSLLDLGCGSGRLASKIGQKLAIGYLGLDIVKEFLAYAKTRSPANYRFEINHSLSLPAANQSYDFGCAFSVFTHLLHSESYLYLQDFHRVLKPGGKFIFSFLEFAEQAHWPAFMQEVGRQQNPASIGHLNTFIERSVIPIWAARLGYSVETIVGAHEAPWGTHPLGQSVAVLRKE
jgi:ubiquinone/menaquinone biosynthesis C-methylase UbiE